jgi:hypothetical protein
MQNDGHVLVITESGTDWQNIGQPYHHFKEDETHRKTPFFRRRIAMKDAVRAFNEHRPSAQVTSVSQVYPPFALTTVRSTTRSMATRMVAGTSTISHPARTCVKVRKVSIMENTVNEDVPLECQDVTCPFLRDTNDWI